MPAIVVSTAPARRRRQARRGCASASYHADLAEEGFAWTRRTIAADLFKPGDLIDVAITKLDEESAAATVTLEQTPLVEGALVAIDNQTGQIKAMVGGWDFGRSKFNRAVQAIPPARIDVQADRLHHGDRSRLHAVVDHHRRAGELHVRQRPGLRAAQLRPQVRRRRSRCATRSRSRATFRRSR